MKSDRAPVAIIGGGFSGTMLAAQLARRGIQSVLIDGSGREGRGTAYSTLDPAHLLNVRAEGMSAWPDRPQDFADTFGAAGGHAREFAERRLFGKYLRAILDQAGGDVQVVPTAATAASQDDDGWLLTLSDGRMLSAEALVLANGNQPPEPLRAADGAGPRFVNNPWAEEAQAAIGDAARGGGDVLLVGTGLTAIDAILSLDNAGHPGQIVAVSRRGLIPKAHADFTPSQVARETVPMGDLRALWTWLRRQGAAVGWRAAIDSLRPHSQTVWQALGPEQQKRFLRHARPWWDVHRHRIAPQVAQRLAEMVSEGRLEIVAGRIGPLHGRSEGFEVEIRRRGRDAAELRRFAWGFNCTGPLGAIERTRDPLLRSLLDQRLIAPDHLGIGLNVDDRARAPGARALWALGPLTKGRYWEIVAVPDIREQVAAVAEDIAAELKR